MPNLTGGLVGSWDLPRWDTGAWDETIPIAEQISFRTLAYTRPFVSNPTAISTLFATVKVTKMFTGLSHGQGLTSFPTLNVIPPFVALPIITQSSTNAPIKVRKNVVGTANGLAGTTAPISITKPFNSVNVAQSTGTATGILVGKRLQGAATPKGITSSAVLDVDPSFIAIVPVQSFVFSSIAVLKVFDGVVQSVSIVNSVSLIV